jgi:nitrogen fixation-related uncharacterized protein
MIWGFILLIAIAVIAMLWALTQVDDVNNCNQDCNQGRNCDCKGK